MDNEKLILDESIHMCSGINCPLRTDCYRYRLSYFFDVIARKAHQDPKFIDPSYDHSSSQCHWLLRPRFQ